MNTNGEYGNTEIFDFVLLPMRSGEFTERCEGL